MTITEANAVNVALRYLVNMVPSASWETPEHVLEAAETLATKANKILGAGLTGPQIREDLS